MDKFGMVIAIGEELQGVLSAFGRIEKKETGAFDVYFVRHGDSEIIVAASGAGEIAAAAATQYLIAKYAVQAILNFGFVGALNGNLKCQQVVLVKDVVHYDFDTSIIDNVEVGRYIEYPEVAVKPYGDLISKMAAAFPSVEKVRLASGDKFIADNGKKVWLVDTFAAEICDMEGAAIILTANRNKIPSLSIKVVSDNADEESPISFCTIAAQGTAECARILLGVIDKIK